MRLELCLPLSSFLPLARLFPPRVQPSSIHSSPHYSAPEIFKQLEYVGTQADVWSLGVVMYTLLNGHFPFQAETMDRLGKKVLRGKYDAPLTSSASSRELVELMLMLRPERRVKVPGICTHPWVLAGTPSANAPRVVPMGGEPASFWDEGAGAALEAFGCSASLARHHVEAGAQNHVTATYELTLCNRADAAAAK